MLTTLQTCQRDLAKATNKLHVAKTQLLDLAREGKLIKIRKRAATREELEKAIRVLLIAAHNHYAYREGLRQAYRDIQLAALEVQHG